MATDLKAKAEGLGIRYFLPTYTSFVGDKRGTMIPVRATKRLQKEGMASFPMDGFMMSLTGEEVFCFPDPDTLVQLPWDKEIGWMACDVKHVSWKESQCPRTKLQSLVQNAKEKHGFEMKTGIEPEFVLLHKDKHDVAFPGDKHGKFHDPHTTMDQRKFLIKVMDIMDDLGWEPYQAEREGFIGQYEFGFGYAQSLTTADRFTFLKFMMKEVAKESGFRVTFMPAPFNGLSMSGMHLNISLWAGDTNLFVGEGRLGVSKTAEHFIAGLVKHAEALCAFVCPSVNSYKRLSNSFAVSTISYGKDTRAAMIRVPSKDRIEFRTPDGSANPYLLHAATLAAGLDGINNKLELDPKEELKEGDDETLLPVLGGTFKAPEGMRLLPGTLKEALDALEGNAMFHEALGQDVVTGFVKMNSERWKDYCKSVSEWETRTADDY